MQVQKYSNQKRIGASTHLHIFLGRKKTLEKEKD
jgi:hypothetical protein